jgi:hypothetical protein
VTYTQSVLSVRDNRVTACRQSAVPSASQIDGIHKRIQCVVTNSFHNIHTNGDIVIFRNKNILSDNLISLAHGISDVIEADDCTMTPRFRRAVGWLTDCILTAGQLCNTDRWELLHNETWFWRVVLGSRHTQTVGVMARWSATNERSAA